MSVTSNMYRYIEKISEFTNFFVWRERERRLESRRQRVRYEKDLEKERGLGGKKLVGRVGGGASWLNICRHIS
jgi:hypothetical protein